MEDVIIVNGLGRCFRDFWAVRDVTFTVHRGEIFGFLGANGAGKSTTIKMLCGLLTPSRGTAFVANVDVARHPDVVKKKIGYMSQKFSLYTDLTISENLEFFGGTYGLSGEELSTRINAILKDLGLEHMKNTLISNLASGVKQRVALGNAVLHEPSVLFLDEPTAGVDPIARREFMKLIKRRARKGTTVFLTTHYMDEAEYCDRVALMSMGTMVALDTPDNLKTSLVKGGVYEINTVKQNELMKFLQGREGVYGVYRNGRGLRVRFEEYYKQLIREVDPQAEAVAVRPTMDDVFHAVMTGQGAQ